MIGTKLYARKKRVYLFLVLYAILAAAGGQRQDNTDDSDAHGQPPW